MLNKKSIGFDYERILKDKKYIVTSTRLAVLETFYKNDKPINAEFICKKLKGKINEATVYRILSSFEKKGILRKVDLRKDFIYFELNNDHHHHLICTKCGEIEEFKENIDIEKLLEKVVEESKKFKNIREHSLELFGYCKVCG
jgi:Fur family ferric uptake transcriptional regulator